MGEFLPGSPLSSGRDKPKKEDWESERLWTHGAGPLWSLHAVSAVDILQAQEP